MLKLKINNLKVTSDIFVSVEMLVKKSEYIRRIVERVRNSLMQRCQTCIETEGGHIESVCCNQKLQGEPYNDSSRSEEIHFFKPKRKIVYNIETINFSTH